MPACEGGASIIIIVVVIVVLDHDALDDAGFTVRGVVNHDGRADTHAGADLIGSKHHARVCHISDITSVGVGHRPARLPHDEGEPGAYSVMVPEPVL